MSDQTFGMAFGPHIGPVYVFESAPYIHRYNDNDEIVAVHRRGPEHFITHHLQPQSTFGRLAWLLALSEAFWFRCGEDGEAI